MNIYQRCWKKRLKVRKLTKFKVDTSKASEDITPQGCVEILQIVDGMVGVKLVPPIIKTSVNLRLLICGTMCSLGLKKSLSKVTVPVKCLLTSEQLRLFIHISHGRSWAQFPSRSQNIFLSFSLHIYHSVCQNLNFEFVCP